MWKGIWSRDYKQLGWIATDMGALLNEPFVIAPARQASLLRKVNKRKTEWLGHPVC